MSTVVDIHMVREAELPTVRTAFSQEHYFQDRFDRQTRGLGEIFVAWSGATPVGNVYLWREPASERPVRQRLESTPVINHLEVAADWRNRGIGTALIRACEQHATALGFARISMGVGVQNIDAQRLYARLGYVDWGHGLVEVSWLEPRPDGSWVRDGEICHWLIRSLPGVA